MEKSLRNLATNDLRHKLNQQKMQNCKGRCVVCQRPTNLKCLICETIETFYCSVECQKVDFPTHVHHTKVHRVQQILASSQDLNNNMMKFKNDINRRLKIAGKSVDSSIDAFTKQFAAKVSIDKQKLMFLEPISLLDEQKVEIHITDIFEDTTKSIKIISGIQQAHYAAYIEFKSTLQPLFTKSREILLFGELDNFLKDSIVMSQLVNDEYSRCKIIGYYKSSKQGCFEDIDTGRKQLFDSTKIVKAAESIALHKNAYANKFQLESDDGMTQLKVGDVVKLRIKGKMGDGTFMANLDRADGFGHVSTEQRIMYENLEQMELQLGDVKLRYLGNLSLLSKGLIHVCVGSAENREIYKQINAMIDEFAAGRERGVEYVPEVGEVVLAQRADDGKFYRCYVIEVGEKSADLQAIDFGFEFEAQFIDIARLPEKHPIFAYCCTLVVDGAKSIDAMDVEKTAEKLQKNPNIAGVLDLDEFEVPEFKVSENDLIFK